MNAKKKSRDMTEGPIGAKLVLFMVPLIFGDLFQQLYNTVDSVIVGRCVNKQALAAVSSTANVINVIVGIFTGISIGATVVIGRYFGSKDDAGLNRSSNTTIFIAFVASVAMTAIGVVSCPLLLKLLSTPEDVLEYARQYLSIYFAGIAGLVFYNMCSGILRAVGDSRTPMLALFVSAAINVVLDLLFVIQFGMEVKGVAYATVFAQIGSAIFLLYKLMTVEAAYRISISHIKPDRKIVKSIFDSGLPLGIQKSLVNLSNTMVLAHINHFGSSAMAAWGVYNRYDQFLQKIIQGTGSALTAFVSQNVGAKKEERIQKGGRMVIIGATAVLIALAAIIVIFRYPLMRVFNDDAEVLEYGSQIMCMMLPLHWVSGLSHMRSGIIRGRGDSRGPMYILLACFVLLRQIYLNVGWHFIKSISFVLTSYIVGWFVALVWLYIYEKKKFPVKKQMDGQQAP